MTRPDETKHLTALTVLLVEDDATCRTALTELLNRVEIDVVSVGTIAAAIAAFQQSPPDLIVSDIALPDGDGFDLMRQIRRLETGRKCSAVPAIALTAYPMMDKKQFDDGGFQRSLSKPVELEKLLEALTRVRT